MPFADDELPVICYTKSNRRYSHESYKIMHYCIVYFFSLQAAKIPNPFLRPQFPLQKRVYRQRHDLSRNHQKQKRQNPVLTSMKPISGWSI